MDNSPQDRWEELLFKCYLLKQAGVDVSHIEPTIRLWMEHHRSA